MKKILSAILYPFRLLLWYCRSRESRLEEAVVKLQTHGLTGGLNIRYLKNISKVLLNRPNKDFTDLELSVYRLLSCYMSMWCFSELEQLVAMEGENNNQKP
jgi:hypothetical protein